MTSATAEDADAHVCPLFKDACRADVCMMWRWKYDKVSVIEMEHDKLAAKGFKQIGSRVSNSIPFVDMVRQRDTGYCGLAGEPEI